MSAAPLHTPLDPFVIFETPGRTPSTILTDMASVSNIVGFTAAVTSLLYSVVVYRAARSAVLMLIVKLLGSFSQAREKQTPKGV